MNKVRIMLGTQEIFAVLQILQTTQLICMKTFRAIPDFINNETVKALKHFVA